MSVSFRYTASIPRPNVAGVRLYPESVIIDIQTHEVFAAVKAFDANGDLIEGAQTYPVIPLTSEDMAALAAIVLGRARALNMIPLDGAVEEV